MSIRNLQPRFFVLLLFIIAAGVLRITAAGDITPFSNFSPVGAMALFGGACFADRWKGYVFPLLTLFLSDAIMMQTVYKAYSNGFMFSGWYWAYIGFAASVLIGQLLIKKMSAGRIVAACVLAAVVHWLIADFGTFMSDFSYDITTGKPFTRDLSGLMRCYALGLPFLKNTLLANLVFSGIFFGLFAWMEKKIPALAVR